MMPSSPVSTLPVKQVLTFLIQRIIHNEFHRGENLVCVAGRDIVQLDALKVNCFEVVCENVCIYSVYSRCVMPATAWIIDSYFRGLPALVRLRLHLHMKEKWPMCPQEWHFCLNAGQASFLFECCLPHRWQIKYCLACPVVRAGLLLIAWTCPLNLVVVSPTGLVFICASWLFVDSWVCAMSRAFSRLSRLLPFSSSISWTVACLVPPMINCSVSLHWLLLRCQICTFQPLYIITRQREMKSSTVASAVWRHCWKL